MLESLYTREQPVEPDSLSDDGRSFTAVLTTEAAVPVYARDLNRAIDEVLLSSGVEFRNHLPVLNNHRREDITDVLGAWDAPTRGDGQHLSRATLSMAQHVEPARDLVRDGALRSVSVGYWPMEPIDLNPGEQTVVESRTYKAGPRGLRLAQKTMIFEGSIVPVGADPEATIRALTVNHPSRGWLPWRRPLRG